VARVFTKLVFLVNKQGLMQKRRVWMTCSSGMTAGKLARKRQLPPIHSTSRVADVLYNCHKAYGIQPLSITQWTILNR
jgi:hypothetical protein